MRSPLPAGFLCLPTLLAGPGGCDAHTIEEPVPRFASATTELPDIVLITMDTTRADHLGLYGYPRPSSPQLDRLASESVVFERFLVPMATTLPVHFSLFTGLEPQEHGVLANKDFEGHRYVPPAGALTLASALQAQGWDTAAFVGAAPVKAATGLDKGFVHFDQPQQAERPARETTDRALAWLEERAEPPYLLWVHYFEPHAPFEPPRRERTAMAVDDSLRAWAVERGLGEDSLRALARYDGEILAMDRQLDRLVGSLRSAGRWDRTLLVVAGDHGEGMGQHGLDHHGMTWQEQIHAPLLIRAPDLTPGRSDRLVTATDLVPTVLGLATLPDTADLLDQGSGRDALASNQTRQAVLSRSSPRRNQHIGAAAKRFPDRWALTTDPWKLHWTAQGPDALYHLPSDPHEQRSQLEDHPALVDELYREGTRRLEAQHERGRELGAGGMEVMDLEVVRQLEGLGYVE